MTNDLQLFRTTASIGSLESYIYQVNQVPMLSKEEEQELATRFREHADLDAARRLVMAHLRFVIRVARGYSGYGLAQADLIQEGSVGLMKAVKRFDPSVGVRLVSFAVHWIKAEIHEFVIRNWRIVKIATTKAQRKLFFNLRSAKKRLGWFTQDEIKDVANELNVSTEEVERMEARLNSYDMAFDAEPDDDESSAAEVAPAHYLECHSLSPAKQLELDDSSEQGRDNLHAALTMLDKRSQTIIHSRWLTDKKETLQTLAKQFNISLERIRQLEKSAMQKLKNLLQEI